MMDSFFGIDAAGCHACTALRVATGWCRYALDGGALAFRCCLVGEFILLCLLHAYDRATYPGLALALRGAGLSLPEELQQEQEEFDCV
jgi:hypothetical protein